MMKLRSIVQKILVLALVSSSLGVICASDVLLRHKQPSFVAPRVPAHHPRTSEVASHRQFYPSRLFSSVTAEGATSGDSRRRRLSSTPASAPPSTSSTTPVAAATEGIGTALDLKNKLLQLLSQVPPNRPTPTSQTQEILSIIRQLELSCPTADRDVSSKLSGTWDLLWTTQDTNFPESKLGAWINPIENQAYSNNPTGRANPILPRHMQDSLERAGFIATSDDGKENLSHHAASNSATPPVTIKSTQSIDIQQGKVRNVVSFGLVTRPTFRSSYGYPFRTQRRRRLVEWWIGTNPEEVRRQQQQQLLRPRVLRASMTVSIDFTQDAWDPRRINVKFESSRMSIPSLKMDWYFPLGIFGPTGWLRTVYLDDTLRITRGHKGSVFVLQRPTSRATTGATPSTVATTATAVNG